jgi:hypothetical protein
MNVATGGLLVKLFERLARPEDRLEVVHLPSDTSIEELLVDDDGPAPDRSEEQADDDQFHDDVRLPKEREQGEAARRTGQRGLHQIRIHERDRPVPISAACGRRMCPKRDLAWPCRTPVMQYFRGNAQCQSSGAPEAERLRLQHFTEQG